MASAFLHADLKNGMTPTMLRRMGSSIRKSFKLDPSSKLNDLLNNDEEEEEESQSRETTPVPTPKGRLLNTVSKLLDKAKTYIPQNEAHARGKEICKKAPLDRTRDDLTELVELTKHIRFFSEMADMDTHRAVMRVAQWVSVPPFTARPGKMIIEQGAIGTKFFVLLEGECVVERREIDGTVSFSRIMPEGSHFGELALLNSTANLPGITTANVVARPGCELISVSKLNYLRILAGYHERRISQKITFLLSIDAFRKVKMKFDELYKMESVFVQKKYNLGNEIVTFDEKKYESAYQEPLILIIWKGTVEISAKQAPIRNPLPQILLKNKMKEEAPLTTGCHRKLALVSLGSGEMFCQKDPLKEKRFRHLLPDEEQEVVDDLEILRHAGWHEEKWEFEHDLTATAVTEVVVFQTKISDLLDRICPKETIVSIRNSLLVTLNYQRNRLTSVAEAMDSTSHLFDVTKKLRKDFKKKPQSVEDELKPLMDMDIRTINNFGENVAEDVVYLQAERVEQPVVNLPAIALLAPSALEKESLSEKKELNHRNLRVYVPTKIQKIPPKEAIPAAEFEDELGVTFLSFKPSHFSPSLSASGNASFKEIKKTTNRKYILEKNEKASKMEIEKKRLLAIPKPKIKLPDSTPTHLSPTIDPNRRFRSKSTPPVVITTPITSSPSPSESDASDLDLKKRKQKKNRSPFPDPVEEGSLSPKLSTRTYASAEGIGVSPLQMYQGNHKDASAKEYFDFDALAAAAAFERQRSQYNLDAAITRKREVVISRSGRRRAAELEAIRKEREAPVGKHEAKFREMRKKKLQNELAKHFGVQRGPEMYADQSGRILVGSNPVNEVYSYMLPIPMNKSVREASKRSAEKMALGNMELPAWFNLIDQRYGARVPPQTYERVDEDQQSELSAANAVNISGEMETQTMFDDDDYGGGSFFATAVDEDNIVEAKPVYNDQLFHDEAEVEAEVTPSIPTKPAEASTVAPMKPRSLLNHSPDVISEGIVPKKADVSLSLPPPPPPPPVRTLPVKTKRKNPIPKKGGDTAKVVDTSQSPVKRVPKKYLTKTDLTFDMSPPPSNWSPRVDFEERMMGSLLAISRRDSDIGKADQVTGTGTPTNLSWVGHLMPQK